MTETTRPKSRETQAALAAGERFAKDTENHTLTVLHDDGHYKHLLFKTPGASWYWYEIITWPGCLTISGDMGTWTFRPYGNTDVIGWFRTDRPHGHDYRINPHYWAEKLQNGVNGGRDNAQEYDKDVLADHLRTAVADRADDHGWPADVKAEALNYLNANLLHYFGSEGNQSESRDMEAAYEFEWTTTRAVPTRPSYLGAADVTEKFKVTFDWDTVYDCAPYRAYTPHFLWVCHAIVTGIDQYDAHTAAQAAALEAAPA